MNLSTTLYCGIFEIKCQFYPFNVSDLFRGRNKNCGASHWQTDHWRKYTFGLAERLGKSWPPEPMNKKVDLCLRTSNCSLHILLSIYGELHLNKLLTPNKKATLTKY